MIGGSKKIAISLFGHREPEEKYTSRPLSSALATQTFDPLRRSLFHRNVEVAINLCTASLMPTKHLYSSSSSSSSSSSGLQLEFELVEENIKAESTRTLCLSVNLQVKTHAQTPLPRLSNTPWCPDVLHALLNPETEAVSHTPYLSQFYCRPLPLLLSVPTEES